MSLTSADAAALVAYAFAGGALLFGLLFWAVGIRLALRDRSTRRQQTTGVILTAFGSVAFVACMVGVRCSTPIADHLISLIR